MTGTVEIMEAVGAMIIIVLLAAVGSFRMYKAIGVATGLAGLATSLSGCGTPQTCGSNKVSAFLRGIAPVFEPSRQFWFQIVTLLIAFGAATLSLIFPPLPAWQKAGLMFRGAGIGSQIVTASVIWYLEAKLKASLQ